MCCIAVWALFMPIKSSLGLKSAWVYHNPLVILSAFVLLCIFLKIKFYSNIVNQLAGAAFTCFLFHIKIINDIYESNMINKSVFILIAYVFSVVFGIYLISYLIYIIYSFLATPLLALVKSFPFVNKNLFDSLSLFSD